MQFEIKDLQQCNYLDSLKIQEKVRKKVADGVFNSVLIIVEHDHVYTLGKNAKESNILKKTCPIIKTNRGGDVTYHGPGQIVVYPIFNLKELNIGVKAYVKNIELVIMRTLENFKINSDVLMEETGVWTNGKKIASIGINVSKGLTMHGLSINVNTDLNFYKDIISCGIPDVKMTSIEKELGKKIPMNDIKKLLINNFKHIFVNDSIKTA